MDRFSFFFSFYGLILGLGVTELLNGLGKLARVGQLRRLGWQTGLLAVLILFLISATWIDAWVALRGAALDFADLWAPVMIAVLYYLAATVAFPGNPAETPSLDDYFTARKRFVGSLLLGAELLANYTYFGAAMQEMHQNPAHFWMVQLPINLGIKLGFLVLIFGRGRIVSCAALVGIMALFLLLYWHPFVTP